MLKFIAINAALLGAGYLTLSSAVWRERRRYRGPLSRPPTGRGQIPAPAPAPAQDWARLGRVLVQATQKSPGSKGRRLPVDQTPPLPTDWAQPTRGATDRAGASVRPVTGSVPQPRSVRRGPVRRWLPGLLLGLLLAGWSDWASL